MTTSASRRRGLPDDAKKPEPMAPTIPAEPEVSDGKRQGLDRLGLDDWSFIRTQTQKGVEELASRSGFWSMSTWDVEDAVAEGLLKAFVWEDWADRNQHRPTSELRNFGKHQATSRGRRHLNAERKRRKAAPEMASLDVLRDEHGFDVADEAGRFPDLFTMIRLQAEADLRKARRLAVWRAVRRLTEEQFAVVVRHHIVGMTQTAIAAELGIGRAAVSKLLSRARATFLEEIREISASDGNIRESSGERVSRSPGLHVVGRTPEPLKRRRNGMSRPAA